MLKIQSMYRIELIKIAKASAAYPCDELQAQIDKLTAIGPYAEATEDEIDSFDDALDAAEAA